jgi:hypothetical protein
LQPAWMHNLAGMSPMPSSVTWQTAHAALMALAGGTSPISV